MGTSQLAAPGSAIVSWLREAGGTLALALCVMATGCAGAPPQPASQAGLRQEAVEIQTSTGTLHGTLLLPAQRGPVPVVLVIAGSGPLDRDGNPSGRTRANNSLKLLAEGLAKRGMATLRYDKRGVGESRAAAEPEEVPRLEAHVEDAAEWLNQLQSDRRFTTVTVLGHSEGSLIGMLAAELSEADALISVAGVARPPGAVLRDQFRAGLPRDLWPEGERILDELEAGGRVDSVPEPLQSVLDPRMLTYVASWFRYEPAEVLARLSFPVLIVHGTSDLQVGVDEAYALQRALPSAELRVIEGMNHVLKEAPANRVLQLAAYSDPSLPVVAELMEVIGAFVTERR